LSDSQQGKALFSDDFIGDDEGLLGMDRMEEMQAPARGPGESIPVARAEFTSFTSPSDLQPIGNIDLLLDVVLRVTVELGRSSLSIREVLALGPGSVIELDKLAGETVDVLVNGTPIAKGEVVVVDEKFGVRITDIVSPAKRVAAPL